MKKLILIVSLVLAVSSLLVGCSQPVATTTPAPYEVIFTKWVTGAGTAPVLFNMAGVVSGDVGPGLFVGEILERSGTATTANITALYHINGGTRQFTARLSIVMVNGTAGINGVVTDGWMKDASVSGNYQRIAPSGIINTANGTGAAFQGMLNIQSP